MDRQAQDSEFTFALWMQQTSGREDALNLAGELAQRGRRHALLLMRAKLDCMEVAFPIPAGPPSGAKLTQKMNLARDRLRAQAQERRERARQDALDAATQAAAEAFEWMAQAGAHAQNEAAWRATRFFPQDVQLEAWSAFEAAQLAPQRAPSQGAPRI